RVFEQSPQLGEVGAGISLSPTAAHALNDLGLHGTLESKAYKPEDQCVRHWRDGRPLAWVNRGQALFDKYVTMMGRPPPTVTPELMVSESLIAPLPRPPQPITPIRRGRASAAAAREECAIVGENAAAAAASAAPSRANSRRVDRPEVVEVIMAAVLR
ncbi:hypothetical protein EBR56_07245, partial [bacterium]|nr:hypothetical protein [bacterium]